MKTKTLLTILVASSLFVGDAYATETGDDSSADQCATECPSGKTKVGFGDGDVARCNCVDPADAMVDTVVDESVQSPIASDGEPLNDNNTDTGVGPAPSDDDDNAGAQES